jgi:hypothetical protein
MTEEPTTEPTEEPTDEASEERTGPDFTDPEYREHLIDAYCATHGIEKKRLSPRAKNLIIERLEVIHKAREMYNAVAMLSPVPLPQPPGQMEYLSFIIDKAFPADSMDRLKWDLEFAERNLAFAAELAASYDEASRPRLHIPGVGETAHINGSGRF